MKSLNLLVKCCVFRHQTEHCVGYSSLSASLYSLHVHPTRRLHQRRPESGVTAHLHHQRHQEGPQGESHIRPPVCLEIHHKFRVFFKEYIYIFNSSAEKQR